mmetsp:Transcript_8333/g.18012  ORF Transcript_8333/g.18012 Transcript_8333/m.18012 type:complete len:200 (-) Transcript_8333:357-956(-)
MVCQKMPSKSCLILLILLKLVLVLRSHPNFHLLFLQRCRHHHDKLKSKSRESESSCMLLLHAREFTSAASEPPSASPRAPCSTQRNSSSDGQQSQMQASAALQSLPWRGRVGFSCHTTATTWGAPPTRGMASCSSGRIARAAVLKAPVPRDARRAPRARKMQRATSRGRTGLIRNERRAKLPSKISPAIRCWQNSRSKL